MKFLVTFERTWTDSGGTGRLSWANQEHDTWLDALAWAENHARHQMTDDGRPCTLTLKAITEGPW